MRQLNVLIACEFSGIVRNAFIKRGYNAVSCDMLPTEDPSGPHIVGDVRNVLSEEWDLMIAHPPCTDLAVSGSQYFKFKRQQQEDAIQFVWDLMAAPIPHVALENPIGVLSSRWRKPDQIIQPYHHGHGETKATCFWLRGLPRLEPTLIVSGREPRVHHESPGPERWKNRSRTLWGIAEAMAYQWGAFAQSEVE